MKSYSLPQTSYCTYKPIGLTSWNILKSFVLRLFFYIYVLEIIGTYYFWIERNFTNLYIFSLFFCEIPIYRFACLTSIATQSLCLTLQYCINFLHVACHVAKLCSKLPEHKDAPIMRTNTRIEKLLIDIDQLYHMVHQVVDYLWNGNLPYSVVHAGHG